MVIESVDPEHRRVDKAFDRGNPVESSYSLQGGSITPAGSIHGGCQGKWINPQRREEEKK